MIRESEFGKRITTQRKKLELKQNTCAQLVGVSRQLFNNWEIGICKPKGLRMQKLATVLECDAVWLEYGEGSELEDKIETAMQMMRVVVRDLNHIHKAIRHLNHGAQ